MANKKLPILLLLLILLVPFSIRCDEQILPQPTNDFILMSLPKSGSHLMCKLLKMLSSNPQKSVFDIPEFGNDRIYFHSFKNVTPQSFLENSSSSPNTSFYSHFNSSPIFRYYAFCHPSYAKFVLIRDLRDVCISTAFYIDPMLKSELGSNLSFDEKLLFVIEGTGFLENFVFNIEREAQVAVDWIADPSVVLVRFEDLCGPNGGGSRSMQEKQIALVAETL